VSVNFVGRIDPPAATRWRLAPEAAGREYGRRGTRPTVLDLVAWLEDECLVIDWHYDAVLLAARTIERCVACFDAAVRELAAAASEEPDVDASDGRPDADQRDGGPTS
jgi:hypothetical protein